MKRPSSSNSGSTLVITIAVVATLLVLLGVAMEYTTQISRTTQRTRNSAVATEIADGHLEALFTSWRNIYRTTWTSTSTNSGGTDLSLVGTNYFFTSAWNPGPAPTPIPQMSPAATPPVIPLPSPSNFPTSAYSVSQYRIQAVDPMISLNANEDALIETSNGSGSFTLMSRSAVPPPAYGPNTSQFSYFYLASVDVTVPSLAGNVTSKVRRVFEKKFDQPWTYALFYNDDLELQPTTALDIKGPIHTNAGLYIGSSNFTASSYCEYGSEYVNGYAPKDPRYPGSSFTTPNFAKSDPSLTLSDSPPSQVSPYLPFGWTLKFSPGNANAGTYHEILEPPVTGTDPLAMVRYYNQPSWRVIINADGSTSISRVDSAGTVTNYNTGGEKNALVGNSGQGTSSSILRQNIPLYDAREGTAVKVTTIDVGVLNSFLASNTFAGWTGLLYVSDAGGVIYNSDGSVKVAGTPATVTINGINYVTSRRAFRIINGTTLPSNGLTIVSNNPVYITGNYNTGGAAPLSNASPPEYAKPTVTGYTRKPAAVVADAITILSPGWNDGASASSISGRQATANMTVNAALVAGNVPSNGTAYSGGAENFIRFLEDWKLRTFCYYGSMVQLYASNQATGPWDATGAVYKSPMANKWFYDPLLLTSANPPGNLQVAAYLQQQRWYQVY